MTPCIPCSGWKDKDGYGRRKVKGRGVRAHRYAWEQHFGPIPVGMQVLHRCDNPACVNPAHLFLGTQRDNIADMYRKNRQADFKGANSGGAKITEATALKIKSLCGQQTGRSIAKMFGISEASVSQIKHGKQWGHLWQ